MPASIHPARIGWRNSSYGRPRLVPETPTAVGALSAVMADVQSVAKRDRNQAQSFNFRGIDAVMNAVGPALRAHGMVVMPVMAEPVYEAFVTAKGTAMKTCVLTVTWRFYGPAGDWLEAVSVGEAADSGDKATSKAHSVAYRTVLLQALCIPTDEPDPDSSTYERGHPSEPWHADERHPAGRNMTAEEHLRADEEYERFTRMIDASATMPQLAKVGADIASSKLLDDPGRSSLRATYGRRVVELHPPENLAGGQS